MSKRYYVGTHKGELRRTVFTSTSTPTQATHGAQYAAVIGPFRTKRAASFMALFGSNNPHLQTVLDAERIARQEQTQAER